ncbi:hypothetical protein DXX93_15360 [Thalassotalea euphylliae]|uniref:Imelysin-like domain-containing protein n=1 Tax=Thalassotalea euphylliae TaxID=1655234 RepID=A0A3E0TTN6_9GAMM|nr:imelysin family protein [Thalassotalea euphylliae]REL27800.1 hypothetical protein DXX93_15360 [Thalassotalea euphylliae]
MKTNKPLKLVTNSALVALTLSIASCGGGGESSEPDPAPTPTPPPAPAPNPTPEPLTQDQAFEQYLTALTSRVIVTGYQNFQTQAQALMATTAAECQNAGASNEANDFTNIKTSWRAASQAWQAIIWLKQGPAGDSNNRFKIQAWPDANNTITHGVSALEANPETVTAETVAAGLAGSQGLSAMEYILYRTQATPVDPVFEAKECEVLSAIATNVHNLSVSFTTAWQASDGIQQELINGTGNYSSRKDAIEEIVSDLLAYSEIVKDDKLTEGLTNTARAENAVSDLTTFNVRANIDSFAKAVTADDDFGLDDVLIRAHEQDAIATQLIESYTASIAAAAALDDSFQTEAGSVEGQARINALADAMDVTQDLIDTELVQALDINPGFNSNDGD